MTRQETRIVMLSMAVTLLGGWATTMEAGGAGPEYPRLCVTAAMCQTPEAACVEAYGGEPLDWNAGCIDIGWCEEGKPYSVFCQPY